MHHKEDEEIQEGVRFACCLLVFLNADGERKWQVPKSDHSEIRNESDQSQRMCEKNRATLTQRRRDLENQKRTFPWRILACLQKKIQDES